VVGDSYLDGLERQIASWKRDAESARKVNRTVAVNLRQILKMEGIPREIQRAILSQIDILNVNS
jgi:hypothetical protein